MPYLIRILLLLLSATLGICGFYLLAPLSDLRKRLRKILLITVFSIFVIYAGLLIVNLSGTRG